MARWKPFKKLRKMLRGKRPRAAKPVRQPVNADRGLYFGQLIEAYGIDTIIDVGANAGQFARSLRRDVGYRGKIISIEPLPHAYAKLTERFGDDQDWSAFNLALGDAEGRLPINIAGNSGSSSFLPMLWRHEVAAPRSRYLGQVEVRIARLDGIPDLCAAAQRNAMLKIDTQGYELSVLRGAGDILDYFFLVYLEVSFVPLYENGPLIEDVIGFLRQRRFDPILIKGGFADARASHQLQADILFARTDRMAEVLTKVDRNRT